MAAALSCSNHLSETAVYRCGPCGQALCAACAVELKAAGGAAKCAACGALLRRIDAEPGAGGGSLAPRPDTPVWTRLSDVFAYLGRRSVLLVLAGLALARYLLSFVPMLGPLLAFGLSAGVFFQIVASSAVGERELDPPDFTDLWDIISPALRYTAAVLPLLVAVIWAGGPGGLGARGSPLAGIDEMTGPLVLLVGGVVLLPLLLAIGGLGRSILAMYNPLAWIDALRKMGADYAAGALLFYLVLVAEYGVLHPALASVIASAHIPALSPLLAGFVALLPWAFRARLIGAVCERYTERELRPAIPQPSVPRATARAGGETLGAPAAAAEPPPPAAGSREEELNRALAGGDSGRAGALASEVLDELARERRPERVAELFGEIERRLPGLEMTDRALAAAARSANQVGDAALTVRAVQRLLGEHPRSELLPAAMWTAAGAQESQGRHDLAEKTLRMLIERFPHDPVSEQARHKLERE